MGDPWILARAFLEVYGLRIVVAVGLLYVVYRAGRRAVVGWYRPPTGDDEVEKR